MGWEYRHGKRYYYRKVRLGARVISQYQGYGTTALLAEMSDWMAREDRAKEHVRHQQQEKLMDNLRAADLQVRDIEQWISTLCDCALLCAGFHHHHRQWRRIR